MPVTVFPNHSGTGGFTPRTPIPNVHVRRPTASGGTFPERKQSAIAPYPGGQNLAEDTYQITSIENTLLRSTFLPNDSRRLVYHVTTDMANHNSATTILWSCDPGNKSVSEVARISWSTSGKTIVQMGGVRLPANEFLIKSKWRLGMSSSRSQTFISQMEEYKWIPQPTLFDSPTCVWHCIVPITRGHVFRQNTILSVYRPPALRDASQPSHPFPTTSLTRSQTTAPVSYRSSISGESFRSQRSRSGSVNHSVGGGRHPAVLEMYPEVNSKPHLREIMVLTAILVIVHKDEWRNLPHSWTNVTSSDAVLSCLLETHDPDHSSLNLHTIV